MNQEASPPAARVAAAGILLDRGWGRAPQAHTGEDGGDLRIVFRQIVEAVDEDAPRFASSSDNTLEGSQKNSMKVIEHDPEEGQLELPLRHQNGR
jgi:hypothetical protein